MAYDGGKAGAGVYQTLINQMPPHGTYIEPFLGDGAILRRKLPASRNVGVEIDAKALAAWNGGEVLPLELYHGNSIEWLKHEFRLLEVATSKPATMANDASGCDVAGEAARVSESCDCSRNRAGVAAAGVAVPDAARGSQNSASGAQLFADFGRSTLVYADPPYPLSTRRNGAKMYRYEMTDEQHEDLLKVLRRLPCMVMVSSYWSEMYADSLADWRLVRFQAQTRTGIREECLWLNFPEATRLHDSRFVGKNKRQRERIRRRARNWKAALKRMPPLERQHILDAITGRHKPRPSIDCP